MRTTYDLYQPKYAIGQGSFICEHKYSPACKAKYEAGTFRYRYNNFDLCALCFRKATENGIDDELLEYTITPFYKSAEYRRNYRKQGRDKYYNDSLKK